MATALSIIKRALRINGDLATGATPETSIQTESLEALNAMIESWQNEKLTIYDTREDSVTITPSTATYTVGSGGSFNIPRPSFIESVFIRNNSIDYMLKPISDREYASIPDKSATTDVPSHYNYKASYSTGTLTLYPIPTVAYTLYLRSWRVIAGFATTGDSVSLPPGYEDALAYNLAVRIAPESGTQLRPDVIQLATETKAAIKRTNNQESMKAAMPLTDILPTASRTNIYTDM